MKNWLARLLGLRREKPIVEPDTDVRLAVENTNRSLRRNEHLLRQVSALERILEQENVRRRDGTS